MNQLAALRVGLVGSGLVVLLALVPSGCGGVSVEGLFEGGGGKAGAAGEAQGGDGSGGQAGQGGVAGRGGQAGEGGVAGQGGHGGDIIHPPFACQLPTPIWVLGKDTGLVQCDGGMVHRAHANECPARRRSSDPSTCAGPGGYGCTADTDCNEQPLGYCTWGRGGAPMCQCEYGCKQDSDCGRGRICVCGDPAGVCVPSSCKTDGDCGGTYCTQYVQEPYCGGAAFACQTQRDACATDQDCQSEQRSGACTRDTLTGPSYCTDEICMFEGPPGRP